jgi:hypothetical protein
MTQLPPLPYPEWRPTKETLHLWVQIVGKVKLASAPPKNHWWHVALYLDVHGLTTRLLHASDGTPFEIRFDFATHRLVLRPPGGVVVHARRRPVGGRLRPAAPRDAALGVNVTIAETPFGAPTATLPFAEDEEHRLYDARR